MHKTLHIYLLTLVSVQTHLFCMKPEFPYKPQDIQTDRYNALQGNHLKDSYVVDGTYFHNRKQMWFRRNILCMLRAKIPTPDGIKNVVLPAGKIYPILHKLQKLTDEEFSKLSDFELGITERNLKTKHRRDTSLIWSTYDQVKNQINRMLNALEIYNRNIMRYILFSLQGDKNASPFLDHSIDEKEMKEWESCMPKYIYDAYMKSRKQLKAKLRQEILSDLQRERGELEKERTEHEKTVEEQTVGTYRKAFFDFQKKQMQQFNSSHNSPIDPETLSTVEKKLKDLKKENKNALQTLLRLCHYIENTNINSFIQQSPTIQKHLILYLRHNLIKKTIINKPEGQTSVYAINSLTHATILRLTDYSITKLPKKKNSGDQTFPITRISKHRRRHSHSSPRRIESPRTILMRKASSDTDLTPRSQQAQENLLKRIDLENEKGGIKRGKDKKHKRHSGKSKPAKKLRHSPGKSSSSSSSQKKASPTHTPQTKRKLPIVPRLALQTSTAQLTSTAPRRQRSNSFGGTSSPKIVNRGERSRTDGDLTERSKAILRDLEEAKQ